MSLSHYTMNSFKYEVVPFLLRKILSVKLAFSSTVAVINQINFSVCLVMLQVKVFTLTLLLLFHLLWSS